MATMKEYKERKAIGNKIMYYWGMFVIFILIPVVLGYGIIFG